MSSHANRIETKMMKIEERIEACETNIRSTMENKITELETKVEELTTENTVLKKRIERLDKSQRRSNIKIVGLNVSKEEVQPIMATIMKKLGEEDLQLKDVVEIKTATGGPKFVAKCDSIEEKRRIMSNKRKLAYNNKPVYVTDDLTQEEEEIQYKLRRFAETLGPRGTSAVAYKRVYHGDKCYEYDEQTQQITEKTKNF